MICYIILSLPLNPDIHHPVRPLYTATFTPTSTDVCEQPIMNVIRSRGLQQRWCAVLPRIIVGWTTHNQK